jgi:hypothetical protein
VASYWVASEGKQRIPGSRLTGATVTPAGVLHAVDDDGHVLCGARLSALVAFRNVSWDKVGSGVRCAQCRAAASGS